MNDLKFSFRTLRRSPGFAARAFAVLTIGIAANTSILTVVNAVILVGPLVALRHEWPAR